MTVPTSNATSMSAFYQLLGNGLLVAITNNFVWFTTLYWIYLSTQSVLVTSVMTGIFLVAVTLSGFWLGSIVDHHKKKVAMLISSCATLGFFVIAFVVFLFNPEQELLQITSVQLWVLVAAVLFAVIAGNIRNIALPTTTTILVDAKQRDKANGMSGTVMGISMLVASITSGFALGYLGMFWVYTIGIVFTTLAIIHLGFIHIPEPEIIHTAEKPNKIDIKGTIKVVRAIPGLFALIFFTLFNNFLGGVFMPLMDAYGLSLMSVQMWGLLFGFLSLGFIAGGVYIAKYGLGKNPLRALFLTNITMWTVCIFFVIQPWIGLLALGMFIWMAISPFIEASEQTIIQKVVPVERQGRVFGFAQSVEMSASPITAFLIGPIAQFIFIPFMTTGAGVQLIGPWFGIGLGRGIALVFIAVGIIGLTVTLLAMRSRSYKLLSQHYKASKA